MRSWLASGHAATLVAFLAAVSSSVLVVGDSSADHITYLPGLMKQPSFNQYSGYLNGTGTHMLHYWYVESQDSPKTNPLIVWLGGGPGCSSIYSVLHGNGPFTIQADGINLDYNANSWNKFANMLYIESPPGVGFSYSDDGQTQYDDDQVTEDHYAALKYFMTIITYANKNPLYLMGEGYAGVYVPLLAQKIQAGSKITSLQGFAVANGMTSESQLANSLIYFTYYRGIIGDQLWSTLQSVCCHDSICNFYNSSVKACSDAVDKALYNIDSIGINPYNILADCAGGALPPGGAVKEDGYVHFGSSPVDLFKYSEYVRSKNMFLHKRPSHKLKQELTCVNTSLVTTYLNDPYVRQAIHIDTARPQWQICNAQVQQSYTKLYPDMTATYISLQETYIYHMLVYNGDVDAMDNCLGDEWFVDALGLEEEVQWRTWLYNDSSLQVAGFVKEYDHIAFATIKGAGHMSAWDNPIAAAQLISNFVKHKPF